jgi:FKBP12-rapamycin complex-associated protein
LSYYAASTEHDSNWYKAWHAWAVMNFETCLFYRQQQQQPAIAGQQPVQTAQQETKTALSPQTISNYAVPALKGFVRSISLSKGSSLQDTLRLLTLLFDYGHQVGTPFPFF